jgi:predicted transcriptional regulator
MSMDKKGPVNQSLDKVKLSLFVSPQLNETLENLARQNGSTKSDVLRKALALLEVASEAKKDGKRIGILTGDRQVLTEIVGV